MATCMVPDPTVSPHVMYRLQQTCSSFTQDVVSTPYLPMKALKKALDENAGICRGLQLNALSGALGSLDSLSKLNTNYL